MAVKKLNKQEKQKKKDNFIQKLSNLSEQYKTIVVVKAENVSSKQMTEIRLTLAEHGILIFGKKTLMRYAVKQHMKKNPKIKPLLELLKGNVGLIFTNESPVEIRKVVTENKVAAPARQGQISPSDVVVPKGNTGLEPTKTAVFQNLNIPTKITKGTVDILNDTVILKAGEKVGNSEAALLKMLEILPFFYGIEVVSIFEDGITYGVEILDTTEADYMKWFQEGINNVAAISLETDYMTAPAVPHIMMNAFRDVLGVCAYAEYETEVSKQILEFIKDPSKFQTAVAAPVEEKKEEVKEEEEEEKKEEEESEEEDMGFGGLF